MTANRKICPGSEAMVERASGDELAALAPIILELLEILDPHVAAPIYRAVPAHGGYARTIVVPEVDVDVVALARFVARRRMDETAPNELVGQLFREDGAKKVRRGMAGVVREGRYAGGRAYGYRPTPGEPGRLRIDPQEAAVVRRIFEEYAAGRAPRDIAFRLNREGVPAPRGAVWNASTINGNRERTNGIIQNPIYGGEIVWNRIRMVKDPATGRRVSRPNPESEWQRREAPELRIVPEETLATALARKRQTTARKEPTGPRRYVRSVLSGVLKCGACGSGMSKHDNSAGRPRIRCSRATESGSCANRRNYYLDRIEAGVIEALREELDRPELLAEFVRAYHEEQRRLSGQQAHGRAKAEMRLGEVRRQLDRLVDVIAAGGAAFDAVRGKMEALESFRL